MSVSLSSSESHGMNGLCPLSCWSLLVVSLMSFSCFMLALSINLLLCLVFALILSQRLQSSLVALWRPRHIDSFVKRPSLIPSLISSYVSRAISWLKSSSTTAKIADDMPKSSQLNCADKVNTLIEEFIVMNLTSAANREIGEEWWMLTEVRLQKIDHR